TKEIILECRRYPAAEAQAMGLVHRIVPGHELAKAVREHAERLAAKPLRPLAEAKARINAIAPPGIPQGNPMTQGFLDPGQRSRCSTASASSTSHASSRGRTAPCCWATSGPTS